MKKRDRIAKKRRKRDEKKWRRLARDPRMYALVRESVREMASRPPAILSSLIADVVVDGERVTVTVRER